MEKEEFNIENLEKELGLDYNHRLQPYDYEKYNAVNPNLTKDMYHFLRGNGSEWKILCGLKVIRKWSNDVLEPVWYLNGGELYKDGEIYKNRYNPEYYLGLDIW
jgi:hypothetical protein